MSNFFLCFLNNPKFGEKFVRTVLQANKPNFFLRWAIILFFPNLIYLLHPIHAVGMLQVRLDIIGRSHLCCMILGRQQPGLAVRTLPKEDDEYAFDLHRSCFCFLNTLLSKDELRVFRFIEASWGNIIKDDEERKMDASFIVCFRLNKSFPKRMINNKKHWAKQKRRAKRGHEI